MAPKNREISISERKFPTWTMKHVPTLRILMKFSHRLIYGPILIIHKCLGNSYTHAGSQKPCLTFCNCYEFRSVFKKWNIVKGILVSNDNVVELFLTLCIRTIDDAYTTRHKKQYSIARKRTSINKIIFSIILTGTVNKLYKVSRNGQFFFFCFLEIITQCKLNVFLMQ